MFLTCTSFFGSFFSVVGFGGATVSLQYLRVCPDFPQLWHFWERRVGHVTRPALSLTQWDEHSCSDFPASRHTLQFGLDILKVVWFLF